MGGGANRYRDQRLAQALELEQIVALLTYRLSEDRYRLELCDGDSIVLVTTGQLAELGELLRRLTLGRILLNNLVSYPDVRRMIDTIRRVTASSGAKLELPLHDFFAVCPSFNLLDDRQEFCGVPELDRCRACIARVDLPEPVCDAPRAIDAWREAWSPLLLEARDIIAFSGSSRELFARAYPDLGHQRVVVRPHTVDYLPQRKVAVEHQRAAAYRRGGRDLLREGGRGGGRAVRPAATHAVAGPSERHRHPGQALRRGDTADRPVSRGRPAGPPGRDGGSMSAWCRRSGPRPSATSPRS